LHWHFLVSILSVVLIDLVLGGDNAVVIACSVRGLSRPQRSRGIAVGAACAVILRVAITFFAADLLGHRFLQLAGGVLILWIAVRLLQDAMPDAASARVTHDFWKAVGYIVAADVTMSTDNILAIAAVSKGNLSLLIFGLGLSIPLVVFASNLLSRLMDRYPLVVYLGAAILGRVGMEMILTDSFVAHKFHPAEPLRYFMQALAALAVVAAGRLRLEVRQQQTSHP